MSVVHSLRTVIGRFATGTDDYDLYDETYDEADELDYQLEERLHVRRLPRSHGSDFDDIYAGALRGYERLSPESSPPQLVLVQRPPLEFSLVAPRSFDEAQAIADRFRADAPVIVDLQGCDAQLAKRVIDFCSGLVYALDGSLQFMAQQVLLLSPQRVDVSCASPGTLHEKAFYNQA